MEACRLCCLVRSHSDRWMNGTMMVCKALSIKAQQQEIVMSLSLSATCLNGRMLAAQPRSDACWLLSRDHASVAIVGQERHHDGDHGLIHRGMGSTQCCAFLALDMGVCMQLPVKRSCLFALTERRAQNARLPLQRAMPWDHGLA